MAFFEIKEIFFRKFAKKQVIEERSIRFYLVYHLDHLKFKFHELRKKSFLVLQN